MDEFIKHVKTDVEEKNNYLISNWYQGCVKIIAAHKESIEAIMPEDSEVSIFSWFGKNL